MTVETARKKYIGVKSAILYNMGTMLINCPNCFDMFHIIEEIDEKGTTAEFDTVITYLDGEIYEDVICEGCDQTFDIKKIKQDKWESLIDTNKGGSKC